MSEKSRFWDKIAQKYARTPVRDEGTYHRKLEMTRGYLRPDMHLLEFGCGTGTTAIAHAPYVASVTATDISTEMLAIGREKAAAADITNVTFEVADLGNYQAAPASQDVVLALSLLHLLQDPQAAIRKVSAMLKPGGLFVTSTACIAEMGWLIRLGLPLARLVGYAPFVNVFRAD
ncbi:MAG: class I SAM-dependent methyltransferase, partial [Pseudomonadota bacterium]